MGTLSHQLQPVPLTHIFGIEPVLVQELSRHTIEPMDLVLEILGFWIVPHYELGLMQYII